MDANPLLGRCLVELNDYDAKIVHVAGTKNTPADALSSAAEGMLAPVDQEIDDIVEFPVPLRIEPLVQLNKLAKEDDGGEGDRQEAPPKGAQ
ncbi:hypothetical protein AAVH_21113 [Aphelenchoides avenae]|nr:hypothetical protein AAVH_21113 [Aphelenchus avenae]